MRRIHAFATIVAFGALLVVPGATATAQTTLTVVTTPDPATSAGSTAYIYSDGTLSTAPRVHVTGPGTRYEVTATAASGQQWDARLPGGAPGVYRVTVTAGQASGTSTYEVVASERGPWTETGPALDGGLLAVDPRDSHTLYVAASNAAELFATHDGGGSWQMERTLPVAAGYPTALLATSPARLVMAINGSNGVYTADPTYSGKILESDDGGNGWRDLQLPDSYVDTVLATRDALVAVTHAGVEVTRDDGRHWTQLAVPWQPAEYSAAALTGDTLYVATLSGLYALHHITTTPTAATLIFAPTTSPWIVKVAADGDNVYADAFRGGLYKSADAGATWTHVYDPPQAVWMLDDVQGRLFINGVNQILVSDDGAQDWTSWPEPVSGLEELSVFQAGRTVIVGTADGGVFATADDGVRYQWLGGVPALNSYSVAVAGDELLTGTESGTFRTSVTSRTGWGSPAPLPVYNSETPLMTTSGTTVYKVVDGPRIGTFTLETSSDAGATWQPLGGTHYGVPGALLVAGTTIYLTGSSSITGNTLYTSGDGGQTWTTASLPATITAMAARHGHLWLGGPEGLWTSAAGAFTKLQAVPVSALAALGDGRLIVAGTRFYRSDDGGVTLTPARQPDLDLSVSALLNIGGTLYAGTANFREDGFAKGGHGVLRSTDGGVSWQLFSAGLTDHDVLSLAATSDGTALFAGTAHGGVFTLRLREGTSGT